MLSKFTLPVFLVEKKIKGGRGDVRWNQRYLKKSDPPNEVNRVSGSPSQPDHLFPENGVEHEKLNQTAADIMAIVAVWMSFWFSTWPLADLGN